MDSSADRMLKVAKVLKSNGTEGEVIVGFYGIRTEDIDIKEPVFIFFDGLPVPFFIESISVKGSKAAVRLTGINSLSDAEEISRADIYIACDSSDSADSGNGFSGLVGWTLLDGKGEIKGTITGFLDIPENPCVEVGEVIVPLHENLIKGIDEDALTIAVDIPDGLF